MGMYTTVYSPGFVDVQFKYGNDECFNYELGEEMKFDSVPDGVYDGLAEPERNDFVDVAVTVKGNRVVKLERIA